MENSTKALLIAAGVLIVIILIAFGIKVFNTPKDVSYEAQGVGTSITHSTDDAYQDLAATFDTQRGFITEETIYYPIDEVQSSNAILEWYGDDGKDKPAYTENEWHIQSVEQLKFLADFVNGENLTEEERLGFEINKDTIIYLENNLNLNNKLWIPIGKDNAHIFKGNFNGNNYTITGLNVNKMENSFAGLFGYVFNEDKNDIIIENINLKEGNVKGRNYVGSIVGGIIGRIENCNSEGIRVTGMASVGGIAGWSSKTLNCINRSTVNGEMQVAGISGYSTEEISNCKNYGNVTGSFCYVGGISSRTNIGIKISNCYNYGNIKLNVCTDEEMKSFNIKNGKLNEDGSRKVAEDGTIIALYNNQYVGGIIGILPYSDSSKNIKSIITKCGNTGEITGANSVGGIVGCIAHWHSLLEECYNTGKVIGNISVAGLSGTLGRGATIINSYNIGKIEGKKNVSGITAYTYGGVGSNIENCYNIGEVKGNENVNPIAANIEKITVITNCAYEEYTIKGTFVNNLDSTIWELGRNGYPILKGLEY